MNKIKTYDKNILDQNQCVRHYLSKLHEENSFYRKSLLEREIPRKVACSEENGRSKDQYDLILNKLKTIQKQTKVPRDIPIKFPSPFKLATSLDATVIKSCGMSTGENKFDLNLAKKIGVGAKVKNLLNRKGNNYFGIRATKVND